MSKNYIQALLVTLAVGTVVVNGPAVATQYHCGAREHWCSGDKGHPSPGKGCEAYSVRDFFGYTNIDIPAGAKAACDHEFATSQNLKNACKVGRTKCDLSAFGF